MDKKLRSKQSRHCCRGHCNGGLRHRNIVRILVELDVGSALSVGDRVYAEIEFDLDSLGTSVAANTQRMLLTLQAYNGSTFFAATQDLYWDASYVNVACPFPNGILQTPIFQVPVATTLMQLYFNVGGAGNFRVARAALRKVPLTVTNV